MNIEQYLSTCQPVCANIYPIANFMGETFIFGIPVFYRSEHGAKKQHEPVRILMIFADCLAYQIGYVAANFNALSLPRPAQIRLFRSLLFHAEIGGANIIQTEI